MRLEGESCILMKELFAAFVVHLIETTAPILIALGVPISIIYVAVKFFS